MKENLDYYKSRQDYEENMLVNLEETLMMESYKSGSNFFVKILLFFCS